MKALYLLFKETFFAWQKDNVTRMAAELTYYTIFSLAPLIMVIVIILSMFLSSAEVQQHMAASLSSFVGEKAAASIEGMMANISTPKALNIASIITVFIVIVSSSNLFYHLKGILDDIWEVDTSMRSIKHMIFQRIFMAVVVFGVGVIMISSFFITIFVNMLFTYLKNMTEQGHEMLVAYSPQLDTLAKHLLDTGWMLPFAANLIYFIISTLMFAMIYKLLPDRKIEWKDIWLGAIVTSILFALGKYLISLYLGHVSFSSTFGAAGSFIVLLVFINYSAQVFLFGAEFTKVYALKNQKSTEKVS